MKKQPVILCCGLVEGELLLPDNLTGRCDICGRTVQYRPHAPTPHILRCTRCTIEQLMEGDIMTTTPQMKADFQTYIKRQKQ